MPAHAQLNLGIILTIATCMVITQACMYVLADILPSGLSVLRALRAVRVFRLFKRLEALKRILISLGYAGT